MIEFLSGIGDAITVLVKFIVNFVTGIVQFFGMIPQYLSFTGVFTLLMPSVLVPFIFLGVFLSVLLLIVGRN